MSRLHSDDSLGRLQIVCIGKLADTQGVHGALHGFVVFTFASSGFNESAVNPPLSVFANHAVHAKAVVLLLTGNNGRIGSTNTSIR